MSNTRLVINSDALAGVGFTERLRISQHETPNFSIDSLLRQKRSVKVWRHLREIVHSDMLSNGEVKVYIEKPDAKDGFHHAICFLPQYQWENIFGFTDQEMSRFQEVFESTAHLIMEFSQQGGFDHAASF